MGSIVHSAFDMYYNDTPVDDVTKYVKTTADEEIAKAPPEMSEDLLVMKYTALGMWMNFPKDLSYFSEIKPELEIKIDFMDDVVLVMKIDGLVKVDGKLWIRELKTTGLSFGQFEKRCETSPQCSLYTYGVRKAGHDVQGVIYDFVKKPLLRRNIKESKEDFGRRIYLSYNSKPDYYYKRHYSYRSLEGLDIFEADLKKTTKDILARCKSGEWYRNPDACWNFNSACEYIPICFQKVPDNLTIDLFFKKQPINPEKGGKDGKEKSGYGN